MSQRAHGHVLLGVSLIAASGILSIAHADTVDPLSSGSIPGYSVTYENGSSQAQGSPGVSGGGITTYSLAPGSYTYGQSFTSALTPFTPTGSSNSYAFYTDFVFSIGASSLDSVTSTINLGTLSVSNLQARLYSYSAGSTTNTLLPAFQPNGPVEEGWSSMMNFTSSTSVGDTVINVPSLGAGTYVLEIRGSAVGATGGSYSGTLNLTTVPLPASLSLLLAGLFGVGAVARRTHA